MFYFQSPSSNYFNKIWYKNTYELFDIDDNDLMSHYFNIGSKLNYNPSLYFNTVWYKNTYNIPDYINPLEHFCAQLAKKNNNLKPNEQCKFFITNGYWNSDCVYVNIKNDFIPLKKEKKRINLLLPALSFSAGPQTIYIFANLLYENNYNVRIISVYAPINNNFRETILDKVKFNNNIEIESLYSNDIKISYDDIFIASAWWTVFPLKFILGYLTNKKFFWFIQENELLLHCADETYAKAIECYNMNYYSFINTSILFDDLKKNNFFKFSNNDYILNNCIVFEPAFDTKLFKYIKKDNRKKLKIIFYSRDATVASRNIVNLLHLLLLNAYKNGILNEENCEIYGFGQKKNKVLICDDFYYEDLGFLDLSDYSKLICESDILISFQMAPHPSYPPLEMLFCNGVCLHTEFSNKTNETMARYSDKILLVEPSINALLDGLIKCIDIIKKIIFLINHHFY